MQSLPPINISSHPRRLPHTLSQPHPQPYPSWKEPPFWLLSLNINFACSWPSSKELFNVVAMKTHLSDLWLWALTNSQFCWALKSVTVSVGCGRTCFPQAASTYARAGPFLREGELLWPQFGSRTPHWACWASLELHGGLGCFLILASFLPSFIPSFLCSLLRSLLLSLPPSISPSQGTVLYHSLMVPSLSWRPSHFPSEVFLFITSWTCNLGTCFLENLDYHKRLLLSEGFFGLSLGLWLSTLLHVAAICPLSLLLCNIPFYEDAHTWFSSSRLDGHLGCSLFLAVRSTAAMNTLGLVFWWTCVCISLGCVFRYGTAGFYGRGRLVWADTSKQFSKVVLPIYFPVLIFTEWMNSARRGFLELVYPSCSSN